MKKDTRIIVGILCIIILLISTLHLKAVIPLNALDDTFSGIMATLGIGSAIFFYLRIVAEDDTE